ncbi:hypothetical protein DSM107007_12470 [Nostoc sp. PCC 7120 = FACHB-418]|nr:hypothetical protein DSM107007_12470 [Nostoc sp. PCC 7120 = FACHB-418]
MGFDPEKLTSSLQKKHHLESEFTPLFKRIIKHIKGDGDAVLRRQEAVSRRQKEKKIL